MKPMLATLVVLVALAPSYSAATEIHVVTVDLAGLPVEVRAGARAELTRVLAPGGVEVRWSEVDPGEQKTRPQVRVVLTDRPDPDVRREVLAATAPEAAPPTALVYLPHLRRALGHPDDPAVFGRALGRVIAHELVHAVVPARGHASRGLMQRALTPRLLLGDTAQLDLRSQWELREGWRRRFATERARGTPGPGPRTIG